MNAQAEVVGINTWTLPEGQNLNFAISSPHIRDFIASAPKTVQPLANLPAPREHHPTSPSKGDPVATFSIGSNSTVQRSSSTRRWPSRRRNSKKSPPSTRAIHRATKTFGTRKVSKLFKQIAKDYAEYAKKVKSLKTENADRRLITMILTDANFAEKLGIAYKEFGDAVICRAARGTWNWRRPRSSRSLPTCVPTTISPGQPQPQVRKAFPTLEETAKETESASGEDDPKKDDGAANKGAARAIVGRFRQALGARTWTDSSGKHKIEARFRGMEDGKAKLEKPDGTMLRVAPEKLSEEDRRFIGGGVGDSP